MWNFFCLFLFVVFARLTNVSAVTDDEKIAFHEAVASIIAECSLEHEVNEEDLDAAKEAGTPDGVKPCFFECLMKKIEILDHNGFYNPEKGFENLKRFAKNDEEFAKFEAVGRKCSKVKDEPVAEGDASCSRAKLFVACIMQERDHIQH